MVVVGVNDPYRFWISTNFIEMKELMKEMQEFYKNHSDRDSIPVKCLQKNYCVAPLNGIYSRATIVDLENNSDPVKLFFIDFGQVSAQKPENIFPLTEDFMKLPAQAVRASIDGIQPPYKGTLWSDEACRIFENSLLLKEIRAEVVELDEFQNALKIKISAPINSVLVTNGHAIFNRVPQKEVEASAETKLKEKIKVIPTFHDLENWRVPWNFQSYLKISK
ncbi:KH domain-containing protein akap-1-like [Harmonia axyridis]|uniref:KH domain-containing protein akap-1-like n=1 Tax=Harmonia axyridis TaxID=115357 RepID=UPI001E279632|nr:KH domain-containing protein akap-1-like [Harmonia axyridis]